MAVTYEADLHRVTVEEYLRLVEALPDSYEHTELIDGVVYDVSPESLAHLRAVEAVYQFLRAQGLSAYQSGSVRLDIGLWAPDVWVVAELSDSEQYMPVSELLLAVEVSTSTLRKDSNLKLAAYARSKVPMYWIIDKQGNLLCHTEPAGDDYSMVETLRFPQDLAVALKRMPEV